ncbi:MAG TPA: hypothetical protein VF594_09085 [Rubricoccaceae bacterium]|jgi:hypothetical protein
MLTFPSELPPDAALGLARNVLRRAGWAVEQATNQTFSTGWHDTEGGPVRLIVKATEVDDGASTAVRIRGERQVGRGTEPVVRPDTRSPASAVWTAVEAAARRVGAEVRYARP